MIGFEVFEVGSRRSHSYAGFPGTILSFVLISKSVLLWSTFDFEWPLALSYTVVLLYFIFFFELLKKREKNRLVYRYIDLHIIVKLGIKGIFTEEE